MNNLCFFIPCIPPKATSQQKGACRTGKGIRFFKKANVEASEKTFTALISLHAPAGPLQGALCLEIHFFWPWRKGEKKSVIAQCRSAPIAVQPDASNLVKSIEDCMTKLGFWSNDGQISDLRVTKRYCANPGLLIRISQDEPELI